MQSNLIFTKNYIYEKSTTRTYLPVTGRYVESKAPRAPSRKWEQKTGVSASSVRPPTSISLGRQKPLRNGSLPEPIDPAHTVSATRSSSRGCKHEGLSMAELAGNFCTENRVSVCLGTLRRQVDGMGLIYRGKAGSRKSGFLKGAGHA